MPTRQVTLNPSKPLEVNVISHSPHVAAYRIWTRPAGGSGWTKVAEGSTADNVPDFFSTGPLTSGAKLHYWVGVGGNPATNYRIIVTLGQGGQILPDGTLVMQGTTNASGVDVLEDEVSFT